MDLSAVAMGQNMKMLSSAVSTLVLRKSMGVDAQSMSAVLEMLPAQQLAAKLGSMDIKV